MNSNLTKLASRGVFWSGTSQFLTQLFQFITLVVLARLLVPDDFGVIGMAFIFIEFVRTINELGLSAAIIQRKNLNESHLSTSFWTSLLAGLFFCIIGILAAPYIAVFFKTEIVSPVVKVLSFGFVLGAFGTVHRAYMEKNLDFKRLMSAEVGSSLTFGVTAIVLAFMGMGVWSLVAGALMRNFSLSALLWILSPWRPSLIFSPTSFEELFSFGRNVLGSRVLNYISANADYLIIGRFLGAVPLGFYTLAYQLTTFPQTRLSSIVSRVAFPAFSTVQDSNDKIGHGYLKVLKYVSLVTFPLLAGLFSIANEFIPLVFGVKWSPIVLPLQILCLAGALKSVNTLVGSVFFSKGRPDLVFKWNIFTVIVVPIAILIGVQYGVTGVAAAVSIISLILTLPLQKIVCKLIDLPLHKYFYSLYPAATGSIILIIAIQMFKKITSFLPNYAVLSGSIIIGIIAYLLVISIIDIKIFKEIKNMK